MSLADGARDVIRHNYFESARAGGERRRNSKTTTTTVEGGGGAKEKCLSHRRSFSRRAKPSSCSAASSRQLCTRYIMLRRHTLLAPHKTLFPLFPSSRSKNKSTRHPPRVDRWRFRRTRPPAREGCACTLSWSPPDDKRAPTGCRYRRGL